MESLRETVKDPTTRWGGKDGRSKGSGDSDGERKGWGNKASLARPRLHEEGATTTCKIGASQRTPSRLINIWASSSPHKSPSKPLASFSRNRQLRQQFTFS